MAGPWIVVVVVLAASAVAEAILRLHDIGDPPVFLAHPEYGFLMRPNQSASTWGIRFQINGVGLRGRDFAEFKPAGVRRIAFLGDSVTYGGGKVADHGLFVTLVARQLERSTGEPVEAVNISAPGWGIGNIAAYVRCAGLHDADVVVWTIPEDDFRRSQTVLGDYPTFPRKRCPLRVGSVLISRLAMLRRRFRRPTIYPVAEGAARVLRQNIQIVQQLAAELVAQGKPIVVILLPPKDGYPGTGDVEEFRAALAGSSVPFVDVAPRVVDSPECFLDRQHLSVTGHKVTADIISSFLLSLLQVRHGGIRN